MSNLATGSWKPQDAAQSHRSAGAGNFYPQDWLIPSFRPLATCTVRVAPDPSTQANGCQRVIPGSHRERTLQPRFHEDRDDLMLTQRARAGSLADADADADAGISRFLRPALLPP